MTTLSQDLGAPPGLTVAEQVDLGEYRRPGHHTVRVFDTLDPAVLLARAGDDRPDWLAGAPEIRDHFVAGMLLEWAWKLYEHAFTELNKNTVQRHMMFRHEFDEVMKDTRQLKFLAFNTDGDVIGLSVYSNNFDALHLISEDYFKTHHPEQHAAKQVWWVGFVAVAQEARGMTTFNELIKAMFAQHGPEAITGIDYAKVNVDVGLAKAAVRYLQRIVVKLGRTVTCVMVDYQGYFLYEYPLAAEEVPA